MNKPKKKKPDVYMSIASHCNHIDGICVYCNPNKEKKLVCTKVFGEVTDIVNVLQCPMLVGKGRKG